MKSLPLDGDFMSNIFVSEKGTSKLDLWIIFNVTFLFISSSINTTAYTKVRGYI